MNKLFKAIVFLSLVTVFGTACTLNQTVSPAEAAMPGEEIPQPALTLEEYFPLHKGAYWIYEGPVKWTQANSAEVVEETIQWKMEVVDEIRVGSSVVYEMRGAPWDLAWYTEGQEPGRFGFIRAGGRIYRVSIETVEQMKENFDAYTELVNENQIFMDMPLAEGKKFCETFSMIRPDDMYCWVVGEQQLLTDVTIKGVTSEPPLNVYSIGYRTLPDHVVYQFAPGVGITHYAYVHHGTVSEVDIRLVAYSSGE